MTIADLYRLLRKAIEKCPNCWGNGVRQHYLGEEETCTHCWFPRAMMKEIEMEVEQKRRNKGMKTDSVVAQLKGCGWEDDD